MFPDHIRDHSPDIYASSDARLLSSVTLCIVKYYGNNTNGIVFVYKRQKQGMKNIDTKTFARVSLGAGLIFAGVSHITFERKEFKAQVPD